MDWFVKNDLNDLLDQWGMPRVSGINVADGFNIVIEERQSWLTDRAIEAVYLDTGGALKFGLPCSKPEKSGPVVIQCFQRYVFRHWVDELPGGPPKGTVDGAPVIDLLRVAGLVPYEKDLLQGASEALPDPQLDSTTAQVRELIRVNKAVTKQHSRKAIFASATTPAKSLNTAASIA